MESLPDTPSAGPPVAGPGARYRIAFLFNAQLHQLMHGLTTAIALAADPAFDVHVIGASRAHLAYAETMIARAGGAPITLSRAGSDTLDAIARGARGVVPLKLARLVGQLRHLAGFDAIALPERTSILLRRLGVRGPRYIHLDHGAGDRAVGFDPRIKLFDFVLLPGGKTRARMLREGYLRPGAHAVVGYPKYDAVDLMRDPAWTPFADARPVVLYNPHFSSLGSWHQMGMRVLEAFAAQDRYNLVFAPHVRLFDDLARRERAMAKLAPFAGHPRIHLDLGSDRSVDMTYPMLADVYLGDVSSQVYEFLRTPRPCVFLDGQARAWAEDENYAHWRFGPVLNDTAGLIVAVDTARAGHAQYRAAQAAGFAETFDLTGEPSSVRAARVIATFLRFDAVSRAAEAGAPALPPPPLERAPRRAPGNARRWRPLVAAQAAAAVALVAGGWAMSGMTAARLVRQAQETIVDEALESNAATMVRVAMRSQIETPAFDPAEIASATAIHLPRFPASWQVTDVQVYPSDAGPGVQVAIRTAGGEALTLLALRAGGVAGADDAIPRVERHGVQSVAYWNDGATDVAIVSRQPPETLRRLAARLAPAVQARVAKPG